MNSSWKYLHGACWPSTRTRHHWSLTYRNSSPMTLSRFAQLRNPGILRMLFSSPASMPEIALVHARVSDSSHNLVDCWYYHWLACESSKSITSGRYEALESTSSLMDTQNFRNETIHGKQFRSVIEAHNRISLDRVDLITLKFRYAIVQDFRDLHMPQGVFGEQAKPISQNLGTDVYTPTLERYFREEYEVYHKAPTLMLIDVMGNALERPEKEERRVSE